MPALAQNPSEGRRLTPEEYIKANYEPQDHLAVLIHHRAKGDTIQRVNTAERTRFLQMAGLAPPRQCERLRCLYLPEYLEWRFRPSPQTGCGSHPPRLSGPRPEW